MGQKHSPAALAGVKDGVASAYPFDNSLPR